MIGSKSNYIMLRYWILYIWSESFIAPVCSPIRLQSPISMMQNKNIRIHLIFTLCHLICFYSIFFCSFWECIIHVNVNVLCLTINCSAYNTTLFTIAEVWIWPCFGVFNTCEINSPKIWGMMINAILLNWFKWFKSLHRCTSITYLISFNNLPSLSPTWIKLLIYQSFRNLIQEENDRKML